MCYYYDGDGVCEDFERETSVKDCGLYTPNGFLDQWATTVEVSHEDRLYCPADVAAGYPAVTKVTASPAAARCIVSICVVRGKIVLWENRNFMLSPVKHGFYQISAVKNVQSGRADLVLPFGLHTVEQRVPDKITSRVELIWSVLKQNYGFIVFVLHH